MRALGDFLRIARSAATTFGSEALTWADSWSLPPAVSFPLHDPPSGDGRPSPRLGSRLRQPAAAEAIPASLPPMPTVTRSVVLVSRSNWGGLVPPIGRPDCGLL